MRYKILSESDDIRLKIYGEDLDDLFKNGAVAIAHVLDEEAEQRKKFVRGYEKVELDSSSERDLLELFIRRVVSLSNKNSTVYPKVKILHFSPSSIKAHISGVKIDSFSREIKSISVEDLLITKDSSGFTAVLRLSN